jgi:hypothetical protein
MKIRIPQIGETICLAEDWTFRLDRNNRKLWERLNCGAHPDVVEAERRGDWTGFRTAPVTLPAGTQIRVENAHIRQQPDGLCITFRILETTDPALQAARAAIGFWVTSAECNLIVTRDPEPAGPSDGPGL